MRPSFPVLAGLDPRLLRIENRQRGYSGLLAGDLAGEGNTFALRTLSQAGFYLNGGDPAALPTVGYNAVLKRMLGTLAEALDREYGSNDGAPVNQGDGEALIDGRPPAGWKDFDEVRSTLDWSQAKLDVLRPYLTLQAWVDTRVVRPNASLAMGGYQPRTWAEIKGFGGRAAPDFEPRAPVNLAWARSRRPVLIALLSDLQGITLNENEAYQGELYNVVKDWVGRLDPVTLSNTWSSTDDCHRVADHIVTWPSALDTWERWDVFCDGIPGSILTGTSDQQQAKRDILKANFNPNSDLNKFNPNASRFKSVDKQDLLAYSTEFSLLDLHGHEITALGRVLDARGRLLATHQCRGRVSGPHALRLSTQREFVCGNLGDLGKAGDEMAPRLPGAYLSASSGLGRTWGAALSAVGGQGVGLQTYPEPYADPGPGLQINPADYDGGLQLATVETVPDDAYDAGKAPQDMKLLACFDDTLDLDYPGTDVPGPNLVDLQPQMVSTPELGLSLLDPSKPNSLYPDGAYSEKDRAPSYHGAGNAHGLRGLLSFWVKPNYDALKSIPDTGTRFRGRRFLARSNNYTMNDPISDQLFFLGEARYTSPPVGILCHFEIGHATSDTNQEHRFTALRRTLPHRWHLVTFYWDFLYPDTAGAPRTGEMVVDAGSGPQDVGSTSSEYRPFDTNSPTLATDITTPDAYGLHRVWLGQSQVLEGSSSQINQIGNGADATFDEFAMYDMGVLGLEDEVETKTFAQARYREGRYYKGARYAKHGAPAPVDAAGRYLSAPLRLPQDVRLLDVAWSFTRPAELPMDYAVVELVAEDLLAPAYLWGSVASSSSLKAQGAMETQRWKIGRLLPGSFRARVLFLRQAGPGTDLFGSMDPNTPLLDSPVFDDLTLVYEPALGPGLLAWGEGS
jgi:hypothetical protein